MYIDDSKPGETCPECGRPTETVTEENYFFKLSEFQKVAAEFYKKHPDFIQPEARRNEVIAFVRGGLRDLSISRTSLKWGIPWPGEEKHVFYVWFDALTTYLSAVGYPDQERRVRPLLARRSASRRQRNYSLPRRVLARVPDGRRLAAAEDKSGRTAGCCFRTTK